MNLDLKDIQIIYLLSKNARENNLKIGKEVNLSSDSVRNRIEKLKNIGIIKAYKTNINYKKLGLSEYDIYLKLKNYTQEELKKIIDLICQNRCVTWVGTCFGKYDLRISLVVNNIIDINEFIRILKNNIKEYFVEYKILYLLEKYKIDQKKIVTNLLGNKFDKIKINKNEQAKNIFENNNENIFKLEKQDKEIIRELNQKPEISLVELSRKIKLTPEGCKYRIEQLKKNGIITSFGAIIDGNKLNKIWAVFLFKIENENSKELINFIKNENNVSAFLHLLGDWNYSVTVFADNVQEIHNILMNFRNKFPEIIKEYELILLFETFKYPSIPDIVFE